MKHFFSSEDICQIEKRGSNVDVIKKQFSYFLTGFPATNIVEPAITGNGIFFIKDSEIDMLVSDYDNLMRDKNIAKFVPASGAATRMFKTLITWLESENDSYKADALTFVNSLQKYAFYDDLKEIMSSKNLILEDEIKKENYKIIFQFLLDEDKLNYKNLPKALLPFHKYKNDNRLAFEEHLVEGALYAKNKNNVVNIHFTISPNHNRLFYYTIEKVLKKYEKRFGVKYNVTTSIQSPVTDTLAATIENEPFRDKNGKLLFRPGGHGALIKNLNELDADIIFMKNIDNVNTESHLNNDIKYKKLLAVLLVKIKDKVDTFLLDFDKNANKKKEMIKYCNYMFSMTIGENIADDELFKLLNRPVRVCGMVKNSGAPGGGPFFVKDKNGNKSLQIVESAQISNDETSQAIFAKSTHFNPVDIVCAIKDNKGQLFKLEDFIDESCGFISEKTYEGTPLKAMELPGLWNGSMAFWNTVFVEVRESAFTPVKSVFDLFDRIDTKY